MAIADTIKNIADQLTVTSHVNAVFGEARTVGRKTIIPIASVNLGFGAGGGGTKGGEETEGGGGGGGARARPLAVLEVTDDETRLIPVIDVTRIVLCSLCFAGAATYMITKLMAKLNQ